MITVLYVMCSEHYSGAEIVLERLLLANRDDVRPVVMCPPGAFADRLRRQHIDVLAEPALRALDRGRRGFTVLGLGARVLGRAARVTWRLIGVLSRLRPEVVHANNLAAAVYVLPAVLVRGMFPGAARWIWSNHDLTYRYGRYSRVLARACHRVYDRTIAVSEAVRDQYPAEASRTVVIYNGLDPDVIRYDTAARYHVRGQWSLDKDTVAVGIIGTIERGKGHHLLVEAIGTIASRWPDVVLLVVGSFATAESKYEGLLHEEIRRHGAGRVRLMGRLDAMHEAYSALDIVVNATTSARGEPLGTTIYEAMACERLVIATRTGGSAEIIDDGVNGFLCEPDSAEALTTCLQYVLSHLDSLGNVRSAARRKVLTHFSVDRMRCEYVELLARLGAPVAVEACAPVSAPRET